ncbi:MAG: dihydropteroate synthase [Desulfobacterales bacterium]|jgi:dihydropteroate synthase|nr:dihydropteroate synthase [Desulfobacterales bacterium]
MSTKTLSWKNHTLEFGKRTCIMGILNITPDSFSDGGSFIKKDTAVLHARKMVEAGADIIDIGGESTRPFSEPVSSDKEIMRVLPVIEEIANHVSVPISIDTTKAEVAKKALEAGASIINDVSAFRLDPGMAEIAAKYKVPVIIMHMKGTPKTMQISPEYRDLVGEIKEFLENAISDAETKGVLRSNIIIDPGIGFGKTIEHNLKLIKQIYKFKDMGCPVLIGPSRKAFIRTILKKDSEKELSPDQQVVETGTQATISAGILNGADIVRVHDVANTFATVKVIDALRNVE